MFQLRQLTLDREAPKSAKYAFKRAKKTETFYGARLRRIAKHIADIVSTFDGRTFEGALFIQAALERYANSLEPYANSLARRMIAEVAQRDDQNWKTIAAKMGRSLQSEIVRAPTGQAMQAILKEQVTLIKSLPIEAAQRIHDLTTEAITTGRRAGDIAIEIMRTGEVTKSRANLIARTEVGRTATALTQARAQYVGSTHFVWRTAGDSDVRPSHRALNGQSFRWDQPPECDPGHHALPGAIFNCRCYPEPILPEDEHE